MTKFKIRKPAADVFEAIVNPEHMSKYWFSSGDARLEPGKRVTWRYEEYKAEVVIDVLDIEPNKKIRFSWPAGSEGTVVTITLQELDDTATLIEVKESGLKEDDPGLVGKMVGQKEGWVYMLVGLKGYLEHGMSDLRASLVF